MEYTVPCAHYGNCSYVIQDSHKAFMWGGGEFHFKVTIGRIWNRSHDM